MAGKNKFKPQYFAIASAVLLIGNWFIKPFPVLVFIGLAPLFVILDKAIQSEKFWFNIGIIATALAASFLVASQFNVDSLIRACALTMLFSLPFILFVFVHQNLGAKTNKFIIIIFWLAIEYLFLALVNPMEIIFLADSMASRPDWFRWNNNTGYLSISAWVLVSNLIFYAAVLKGKINWVLLAMGVLIVGAPIIYSLSLEEEPITKQMMNELYEGKTVSNIEYQANGELIVRTCAWLSPLIILFALVKSRTKKP